MIYKDETRTFYVHPGITCKCVLPIPDLTADPHQAIAMGESVSEKEENIDRFLTEILFPQYMRSIQHFVIAYTNSDLPEKYLVGHKAEIVSLPLDTPAIAWFDPEQDVITIDADSFSIGRRGTPGDFIYAHVFGMRIMHYKNASDVNSAIEQVCSILGISDKSIARMLLADAFGSLVAFGTGTQFMEKVEPFKQEGLQLAALRLAWSA